MNPRAIEEVAKHLATKPGAAYFRSAISRAYYFAFNVVVQFLDQMEIERASGKEYHGVTHDRLTACSDPEVVDAGRKLSDLATRRKWADYEMDNPKPDTKGAADTAVRMAQEIVGAIDKVETKSSRWHSIKNTISQKELRR